ncbi:hypothetical protein Acsp03_04370 [Actinomadura sp. NBRC 104412]|uniref:DUF3618 domain-containing protein n=1 Tax=Actinomadura sp. NBRC 104412 TaxID=3032203 RepID=UPI0024A0FE48|nr:DUF3618 domain-containing protein [Actinomadura sp. NBRC 104412]GLZ02970.1 hypothetical protein Acsp03_04370 [Actinomadura sp. NBRC 104412]
MTRGSQPMAGSAGDGELAGTAQLRAEIERTRRDLGDTVAALAAKTDVKTRARESADRVRADMSARSRRMAQGAREAPKVPMIAVGVAGLAAAALVAGLRMKAGRQPASRRRLMPGRRQASRWWPVRG